MDPVWKSGFFVAAIFCFAVETISARSIIAGGLAVFTVPFAWDAIDAA